MREGSAHPLTDAEGDHRRQLESAMVVAASEYGYRDATVSRVVEVAGVPRATFYRYFADREQCFLAAHRRQARELMAAIAAAAASAPTARRCDAILDALVEELGERPARARFVLVEALGAPAPQRDEHEELILSVDRLVGGFLDEQPVEGAIQIPSTALVAGIGDALTRQVLSEGPGNPERLRSDLRQWIDSYRLPAGLAAAPQARWRDLGRFARLVTPRETSEPALLPRGRSALSGDDAADARVHRILEATARLSWEIGYASLTVGQIAAAARVSRPSFYSHFESKQEALMAAQTRGLQGAMAVAAAEYSPAGEWPCRVWKMVRAFLSYLAEMPHYAHLDFVESYAAGSAAVRHRQQNHLVFALFLEDGYRHNPAAARLPPICTEAIAGAVLGLIRGLVVEGRSARMLSLLPVAAYTILAPFIGPQEAAKRVQEWARRAP